MADGKKGMTPLEAIQKAISDHYMAKSGLQYPLDPNAGPADRAKRTVTEGLVRASAAAEQLRLKTQLEAHPNVSRFITELGDGNANLSPKLAEALVARWRASPDFLDKLEAELPGVGENDPKKTATAQLLKQTLIHPENEGALIGALEDTTKPFDPAAILLAANAPPPAAPPPAATTAPASASSTPPPAGGYGAVGGSRGPGPQPRAAQEQPTASNNHINEFAEALGKAGATYGIPPEKINGFVRAIHDRPELRKKIDEHLQKHPELVVALNDFTKIDGRDVPEMFRSAVRTTLEEIYDDPGKLADPKFTQNFSKNTGKLMGIGQVQAGIRRRAADPGLTSGPAADNGTGGGSSGRTASAGGDVMGVGGMFDKISAFLNDPNLMQKIQGFITQLGPIMEKLKAILMPLLQSLGDVIGDLKGSTTLSMAGGANTGMSGHLGVRGGTRVDPHSGATTRLSADARHDGPAGSGGHSPGHGVASHDHDRVRPGGPGTLIT